MIFQYLELAATLEILSTPVIDIVPIDSLLLDSMLVIILLTEV
jgi:hypothetical protein